jgi:hypothetical protein
MRGKQRKKSPSMNFYIVNIVFFMSSHIVISLTPAVLFSFLSPPPFAVALCYYPFPCTCTCPASHASIRIPPFITFHHALPSAITGPAKTGIVVQPAAPVPLPALVQVDLELRVRLLPVPLALALAVPLLLLLPPVVPLLLLVAADEDATEGFLEAAAAVASGATRAIPPQCSVPSLLSLLLLLLPTGVWNPPGVPALAGCKVFRPA